MILFLDLGSYDMIDTGIIVHSFCLKYSERFLTNSSDYFENIIIVVKEIG